METLLRGGTIVTMNEARDAFVGDVLLRGSKIVAATPSSGSGVAAIPDTAPNALRRVVDARGCAVLPGLIQSHVHLCQVLLRGMADNRALLPWLKERIWPLEAAHDPESLRVSADLGLLEMMCAGTTSIVDMGTVHHHDAVFEAMLHAGVRGLSGKAMMDVGDDVPEGLRETTKSSLDESVRLAKTYAGSGDGRLGYAFAPRFILSCSEELLRATAELAAADGHFVHSHAAEHADERQAVFDIVGCHDIEALARYGISGPKTILAHGVQLTPAEMQSVAAAETRFVHCPSANLKLASGIADVVAMRDAGIVVGIGADGAPCNNRLDPWLEIREAALLAKGKRLDATALPAVDALALATCDAAKLMHRDDLGVIAPGFTADIAVVRIDRPHHEPGGDVASRIVYCSTAADTEHVWVNGKRVVRGGAHEHIDADATLSAARSHARTLRSRAGISS